MTLEDLEPTLRRLRLADPSPELRLRILDACANRSPQRNGRAGWAAWRPELALAASVALLLAAVVATAAPPLSPVSPLSMSAAAHPSPAGLPGDDEALPLLAAAGPMVVPWPLPPDWPPEIPRIEKRLAQELETATGPSPPISSGEPPC